MNEEEKSTWIRVLVFALVIVLLMAFFNLNELKKAEKEIIYRGELINNAYTDMEKLLTDITIQEENNCWLWILDKNGNGISGRTQWNCNKEEKNIGFKKTCESDVFDLNCEWINGTAKGCRCYG